MELFSEVNLLLKNELLRDDSDQNEKSQLYSAEKISQELRRIISIEDLRSSGSFFTGDDLADLAVSKMKPSTDHSSVFFDPTCGVGNLLIAASKFLPVEKSLEKTLAIWSDKLFGFDLHKEFVECTKLRLVQSAISRGAIGTTEYLNNLDIILPNIQVGNILNNLETCNKVTHILLNPPYIQLIPPSKVSWGSGKVNMAAVYVEAVLFSCKSQARFVAILPDVLRSGARYSKWNDLINSKCQVDTEIVGRFDKSTDVDVFLMYGVFGAKPRVNKKKTINYRTLGDLFEISVGPLVAYRDKEVGSISPYACSKSLPKWEEVEVENMRRTNSRLTKPPFLIINRTSSPSDQYRAKATIIKGAASVAVENHLIILKPKDGKIRKCRDLLEQLRSEATNTFLNERIRCRHLTVGSIREIPWQEKN